MGMIHKWGTCSVDFPRTAVRNMEQAGVHRWVAMKTPGHETESIYRSYASAVRCGPPRGDPQADGHSSGHGDTIHG
jgi:hypothetical protein